MISNNVILQNCKICPRGCGADRSTNNLGYCRQPDHLTAARAYLHAWEEPCISGINGSGTVFFSGCNMRCVFCQNSEIASGGVSKVISSERLSEIFLELQEKKASNINLVTPTHFVPLIIPAIERAKSQGLIIPIVYNTSGYEKVETLKTLEGLIDIYLPDCKYYSDELAMRYSHASNYFNVAINAIEEMIRQVGEPLFFPEDYHPYLSTLNLPNNDYQPYLNNCNSFSGGDLNPIDSKNFLHSQNLLDAEDYSLLINGCDDDYNGPLMKSGVIVRHLLLPGHVGDSKKVLKALFERFGNSIYFSIMNQFTPHGNLSDYPELLKSVDPREYDALIDYAIDLGIEYGFFQGEGTDSESFIPAFDFEGL